VDGVEVANRAAMSHELSTPNKGRIVQMTRGNLIGKHGYPEDRETAANIADEPADYQFGPSGCEGVNDPCGAGCD
jgi:hypothetical protein